MESEKYHILIDPPADKKFAVHIEFLARVSENAAVRLYNAYEKALGFLEDSPKSCPPYIAPKPIEADLKYKLFGKRYRIVFEIIGNEVYVYDIQDCRQSTDKSLVDSDIDEYNEFEKTTAWQELKSELDKGRLSGEGNGWISADDLKKSLNENK